MHNWLIHLQVKHVEYGAAWDRASTVKLAVDGRGRSLFQRFVVDVVSMTTGRIGEVVAALNVRDLLDKYGWASVDLVISDMEGGCMIQNISKGIMRHKVHAKEYLHVSWLCQAFCSLPSCTMTSLPCMQQLQLQSLFGLLSIHSHA